MFCVYFKNRIKSSKVLQNHSKQVVLQQQPLFWLLSSFGLFKTMCSQFEELSLEEREKTKSNLVSVALSQLCKKCTKNAFVVLQRKDSYCKQCFYDYCRHKFRATIGKANKVKPHDRIMVAFSGGPSSSAMLDMIVDGLTSTDLHRKLHFDPFFVHVDESIVTHNSVDFEAQCEREVNLMLKTGYRCIVTSLENSLSLHSSPYNVVSTIEEILQESSNIARETWLNQFQQLTTLTAKEEFIRRMRMRLLLEIATLEKCKYLFLGTSGSRLAINVMLDIAQGRGNQIHQEVGFCDSRHEINVMKPMREFVKKEVIYWNLLRNVAWVENLSLTTKLTKKSSLLKLTESFIIGLEKEFPATVYTIVRTGNKLRSLQDSKFICELCMANIESHVQDSCSAINALAVSEGLSSNASDEKTEESVHYCHSCRNLLKNTSISDTIEQKQREQIGNFLL